MLPICLSPSRVPFLSNRLRNRSKIERLEEDLIRESRKVLSAAQVAQLVITLPEINHELALQIRRAAKGDARGAHSTEEPGISLPAPGAPDDPQ